MPAASPKEIVAAASKAGLKFSEGYVGTIRYNAKSQGKKRAKSPRASARSGAARAGTKTAFVLSMPGVSAGDVVVAAKKVGMKLTPRLVYVIRSADKAKAQKRGTTGSGRGRRANGGAEGDLRRAIAELGLTQARRVLEDVEAAFGSRGAVSRVSRARTSAGGRTAVATFILAHSGMAIKDVVAAGARNGLRFSGSYVSRLRSEAR